MRDWIERWSDIETQLSRLLLAPNEAPAFVNQLNGVESQAHELLALDEDATLYWLLQLASSSTMGYSTSHALVCWAICRLVGRAVDCPSVEQQGLALAALTMNIGMTRLQDELAEQSTPPTPAQLQVIDDHPRKGVALLAGLGVQNALWLDIVAQHHDPAAVRRVTQLLQAVDRYSAMISPRETRPGQCVTDSGRYALLKQGVGPDDLGHALVKTVGVCPPGTFVRLEDDRVAIVLRRSSRPGEPWVATIQDGRGFPVVEPALIDTGHDGEGIAAALVTRTVRARLNHARLLQLSRMALTN
jgi:HD-GYP domain-containing protein (c-di-GMP phosphodiesterase class II)